MKIHRQREWIKKCGDILFMYQTSGICYFTAKYLYKNLNYLLFYYTLHPFKKEKDLLIHLNKDFR
jgi:hypothetical protein